MEIFSCLVLMILRLSLKFMLFRVVVFRTRSLFVWCVVVFGLFLIVFVIIGLDLGNIGILELIMMTSIIEGDWRLPSDDDIILLGFSIFYVVVLCVFFGVFIWGVLSG